MKRRSSIVAIVSLGIVTFAACDTGDGTTLKPPTVPTTTIAPEPVDTSPLASIALGDTTSVPLGGVLDDTLPAEQFPDDSRFPEASIVNPSAPFVDPSIGFELFAPFADGGPIDSRYGCDGSNVSPAISWSGVPAGTSELAVAFVDESNLSNGRPFVHWVMSGIDAGPDRIGLAEGEVPLGAVQALNFFGDVAYAGPCPNPGQTNSYRLSVFALNQQLEVADGIPASEHLDLVRSVAIASTDLVGTSTR